MHQDPLRHARLARSFRWACIAPAAITVWCGAAVIVSPDQLDPSSAVIDFESLSIGPVTNPLVIGDITFSSGPGLGIVSVLGYPANGTEVFGATLQPLPSGGFSGGGGYTPITITFARPASQVLFAWFDPNFGGNVAQALDSDGAVLEVGAVQTGPPGGCCAAYIGFVRSTADIASVRVVPAGTGDVYSIDNVHYLMGVPPRVCVTDLTADGTTDGADLGVVLGQWGGRGTADFDASGTVDGADLGVLLGAWGPCR
ncbi:MAG: hypothetical protein JNL80_13265 [Phycisphaerae bacterium]|nr:hypothetical protein [Phycisphaerae bacterium]